MRIRKAFHTQEHLNTISTAPFSFHILHECVYVYAYTYVYIYIHAIACTYDSRTWCLIAVSCIYTCIWPHIHMHITWTPVYNHTCIHMLHIHMHKPMYTCIRTYIHVAVSHTLNQLNTIYAYCSTIPHEGMVWDCCVSHTHVLHTHAFNRQRQDKSDSEYYISLIRVIRPLSDSDAE